ncbi:MAG: hypothetical protein MI757_01770, partial [Pirellulales bacterium]|nr:hypothetical protein [Pirellulales bacterium]
MTRINTNVSSLAAQHQLGKSNSALQTALTRLSSGFRINTGKDDPAGLIASEVLRSEIVSINQAIKNTERANNIISTADAALGEVSKLLNDVRSLVQNSANKGAISTSEIAANQVQLDSALSTIARISQTTIFGGSKLLDGSKAFSVAVGSGTLSPQDITVKSFNPALSVDGADDITVNVTTAATQRSVTITGFNDTLDLLGTGTDESAGLTSGLDSLSLASTGGSTRTQRTLLGGLSGTADASLGSGTDSLLDLSIGTGGAARGNRNIDFALITQDNNTDYSFDINIGGATDTNITFNTGADGDAAATNLIAAINAESANTGVFATAGASADEVVLTSVTLAEDITISNAAGGTNASDLDNGGAANNDATAAVAGTDVTDNTLEITGLINEGGAAVSVSIASNQAFINDNRTLVDAINAQYANTGVQASLSGGITLASGAVVGADIVLEGAGAGTGSVVTATATGNDAALLGDATVNAESQTGAAGTSNTVSYEVIGDIGRAVITVNNDDVLNNSSALVNAINSVTSVTGVTAALDTATGNQNAGYEGQGADITLTSRNYGSAALATLNAIAADDNSDTTAFNSSGTGNTQNATEGVDAAGSVSHAFGSGNFTAVGETITYVDTNVTLNVVTTPADGTGTHGFDVSGGALFQLGPQINFANQVNVSIRGLDLATLGRNSALTGNKGLSALQTGGTDTL